MFVISAATANLYSAGKICVQRYENKDSCFNALKRRWFLRRKYFTVVRHEKPEIKIQKSMLVRQIYNERKYKKNLRSSVGSNHCGRRIFSFVFCECPRVPLRFFLLS